MKFFVFVPFATAMALCVSAQTPPASPKPSSTPSTPAAAGRAKPAAATSKPSKPAASKTKAATPATPADPAAAVAGDSKVVMTVGGEQITATEFDRLIEALPDQYRAQARGPLKRQMAEQIARVKLLAAEARKRGLDKDNVVQARIQFQEDNLLAGATYQDLLQKVTVNDEALKKYYDDHQKEYESAAARHILIKYKGSPVPSKEGKPEMTETEALAKAQEVRKLLLAGSDFAALAKAESDDAGSGANGGDLGTFSKGQMVPAFEEAAFKLPVGQVSEPIKTQFGYHLIRVDKRESKSMDQVRGDIEKKLRPEIATKAVEELRQSAKVTLEDSYFGPAQPVPPVGATAPAATAPAAAAPQN